jgi:hypothetical protein
MIGVWVDILQGKHSPEPRAHPASFTDTGRKDGSFAGHRFQTISLVARVMDRPGRKTAASENHCWLKRFNALNGTLVP